MLSSLAHVPLGVALDGDSVLVSSPTFSGSAQQSAVFLFQKEQSASSSQPVPEPGLLVGLATAAAAAAGLGLKRNRQRSNAFLGYSMRRC